MPTVVDLASALIAVFEGPPRLVAFQDPGGVWTLGQGHTKGVKQGDFCTLEQNNIWLTEDQDPLFRLVANLPLLMAAAFVSFGYNCGIRNLANVLSGQDTILNPKHATDRHGNTLPGLVSRRKLEYLLTKV